MKLFLVKFLGFITAVVAQQNFTTTEELVAAQVDLTLSHRFFETSLFLNRDETSAYLYRINREVIKSHINSYAFIKTLAFEARDEIEAIEVTELNDQCIDDVLNRWRLQYTR
jgi:hypothetical protein